MESPIAISLFCFVFGAIIGSFLSVCVYRIPLGKYEPVIEGSIPIPDGPVSLITPVRSFCPKCEKQLLWWHNIPIVSRVLLQGKCGFCREAVPFRYVLIEVLSACACVLCYLQFGLTLTGVLAYLFVATMIIVAYIDIDYMIIPNIISYPGTILGLLLAASNQIFSQSGSPFLFEPFSPSLLDSVLGVAGSAGLLFAVWWIYLKVRGREGLGLGDVKLLAMIGATFGLQYALLTIFIGSTVGSIIGIALGYLSKQGFSNYIPFGPYLVLGITFCVLDGGAIFNLFYNNQLPLHWSAFQP